MGSEEGGAEKHRHEPGDKDGALTVLLRSEIEFRFLWGFVNRKRNCSSLTYHILTGATR